MKKQSDLQRLLSYAGKRGILTYFSWILSAASALLALVPFYFIWRILKEVIEVSPDFGKAANPLSPALPQDFSIRKRVK